jgi:hypothetical protein
MIMALYETTIASACAVSDKQLVLTSGSSVAIGDYLQVDEEIFKVTKGYVSAATIVPVLRGQNGTLATAHGILARVVGGKGSDWAQSNPPQTVAPYVIAGRARVQTSYGAAGAIDLPPAGADALARLNGTVALAMTLAVPTKDLDGSVITIVGNGSAAHTVTVAGGVGGGALTVATFDASGRCNFSLMAMDEIWVPYPSPLSGTLTSIDVAMS